MTSGIQPDDTVQNTFQPQTFFAKKMVCTYNIHIDDEKLQLHVSYIYKNVNCIFQKYFILMSTDSQNLEKVILSILELQMDGSTFQ